MFRDFKIQLQGYLLRKRLQQIAPELRPVPNPIGEEYILAVLQYSRAIFTDSVTDLAHDERGGGFSGKLIRWAVCWISLATTTAIARSLLVERATLLKGRDGQ